MKKRFKSFTVIGLAVFLAAFSGQEKFVELEGYLNGRSSAAFRRADKNIKTVLEKGTRGEIIESKRMKSGNYGLQIKVLSGPNKDELMWVYYNVNNPDLALYDVAPQSWKLASYQETTNVDEARGVETVRDTPAINDTTPGIKNGYTAEDQSKSEAAKAIEMMTAGTEDLKNLAVPSARPECEECSAQPVQTVSTGEIRIAKGVKHPSRHKYTLMAPRCDAIINNQAEPGRLGQYMIKTMRSNRYKSAFFNGNPMGAFCPRFKSLSPAVQERALLWMWASVGQKEAECDSATIHRVTRVPGIGIWAAEKNKRDRNAADRGEACDQVNNGAYGQALCAIETMYRRSFLEGDTARGDRGSYWSTIRDGMSDRTMRRFENCFNP